MIVLLKRHKINAPAIHQQPDARRRARQRVVRRYRNQHRTPVSPMALHRQRRSRIIDAARQLAQRVARTRRDNQQVEHLLRSDWLCLRDGVNDLFPADFLRLRDPVRRIAEPRIRSVSVVGHNRYHAISMFHQQVHLRKDRLKRAK